MGQEETGSPGLPWENYLASVVLAVKGNIGCQSQTRVDLRGGQHDGDTTCVHFSPSASVLGGAGWQHACKSATPLPPGLSSPTAPAVGFSAREYP